jgi:hypothetical protein
MRRAVILVLVTAAAGVVATGRSLEPPSERPKPAPLDVPIGELGRKFRLVGKLGVPLGEMVTVQGVVIAGPDKGWDGGPNLRVQRINGRAIQRIVELPLRPFFGDFDEGPAEDTRLPEPVCGRSYEFRAYETGGFVGTPFEAMDESGVTLQTSEHHFHCVLDVVSGRELEAVPAKPEDFVGGRALLSGTAVTGNGRAVIAGAGWDLVIAGMEAWPKGVEGHEVEGLGTVRATETASHFVLDAAETRLVRLDDQIGRQVVLRGKAWSMNGEWWFVYRGTPVFVEGMTKTLATSDRHGAPVVVRGLLERSRLPEFKYTGVWSDSEKASAYVVTDAKIEPLDELLVPELAVESAR